MFRRTLPDEERTDEFMKKTAIRLMLYGAMALLALLCGIVAQVGDLSFSLIKREFGIKDYGHLFLEHGGVLDRFDSVLFVTPVIEIILNLVK